jgi:hypothetical protein
LVLVAMVALPVEPAAHKALTLFSRPSHRLAVAEVQHMGMLVQRVAPGVVLDGEVQLSARARRTKAATVAIQTATVLAVAVVHLLLVRPHQHRSTSVAQAVVALHPASLAHQSLALAAAAVVVITQQHGPLAALVVVATVEQDLLRLETALLERKTLVAAAVVATVTQAAHLVVTAALAWSSSATHLASPSRSA